jgi:hypothetical protein
MSEDGESRFSSYLNRVRMFLAGVSYHGKRDMYEILGYNRSPTNLDYAARYLRQDIARRIVNAPVLSTWADPPQIEVDDAAFMTAWENHLDAVPVWHNLIRLDKLAGLGQFAGLVIGFDDGGALNSPVKPAQGRKVIYLQPYAEAAIKVTSYVTDNKDPKFGQPLLYAVSPGRFRPEQRTGAIGFTYSSENGRAMFSAHNSRMLTVADELLEDGTFGHSRLEDVYNLLDDMLKVTGGAAETWWLSANRGMQVDVDKEMDLEPEDEKNLTQEVLDWQNELSRIVRTRGVTMKGLGGEKSDPTGVYTVLKNQISGARGIPQTILFGSSANAQASQQDRAAWAERIGERVREYAEPIVFRPYLNMLINAGVLPKPKQNIQINWPEAYKLSPLERGQTSAQMARSAANLSKADRDNPASAKEPPLFSRAEKRKIVSFGSRVPQFESDKLNTLSDANPDDSPAQPGSNGTPEGGL